MRGRLPQPERSVSHCHAALRLDPFAAQPIGWVSGHIRLPAGPIAESQLERFRRRESTPKTRRYDETSDLVSPHEFQPDLNRTACLASRDLAVTRIGKGGDGVVEVDLVKRIGKLGPQLKAIPLAHHDVFQYGQVGRDQSRS